MLFLDKALSKFIGQILTDDCRACLNSEIFDPNFLKSVSDIPLDLFRY